MTTAMSLHVSSSARNLQTGPQSPHARSLPTRPGFRSHSPRPLQKQEHHPWSPSSSPTVHRLKRKAGSADLTASRLDQSQAGVVLSLSDRTLPFSALGDNDVSQHEGLTHSDQLRSENIHSSAFDFNRYYKQQGHPTPLDPRFTDRLSRVPSLGPDISHRSSRSHPRSSNLKRTKRLRNDENSRSAPSADPSLRSSTNNSRSRTSTAQFSDASTPSLSRFPLPPTTYEPTPLTSSEGRDEPRTPTVYHLRGVSFEIVNPRRSLCIQNIETPADQDTERTEYFESPRHNSMGSEREAMRPESAQLTRGGPDKTTSHQTPPRALFDDLPSAYTSITSRSIQNHQDVKARMRDLPLPPVPLRTRKQMQHFERISLSSENLLGDEVPDGVRQPSPAASFRQRFSQVLRFRKGRDEEPSALLYSDGLGGAPNREDSGSENSFFDTDSVDDAANELEVPHASSPESPLKNRNSQRYYNDSSLSGSLIGSRPSVTLYPPSLRLRRRRSSCSASLSRDESTGRLIECYENGFGDSSRSSAQLNPLRRHSLQLLPSTEAAREETKTTDSTIGEILQQYHRLGDFQLVPPEPATDRGVRSASLPGVRDDLFRPKTSSLSKFDFGWPRQPSPPDANTTRFPDKNVRSASTRALYAPTGAAPVLPLPEDPSNRLTRPQATPASRDVSGYSATPSALSYGDTRNLLLLSQSSMEIGRGAAITSPDFPNANSSLGSSNAAPSSEIWRPSTPKRRSGAVFLTEDNRRASGRSFEDVVNRDLRYLSGVSGLSELQGSVYVVGTAPASSVAEPDSGKRQTINTIDTQPSPVSGQHQTRRAASQTPAQASFVPVAAFTQSAVVPGIWRLSPAEKEEFDRETGLAHSPPDSQGYSEDDIIDDGGDDFEWETIAESRPTFRTVRTDDDSFADYSSYDSLNAFHNVGVHPGDERFQHTYRLHSPANSDEPVLMPSYDFRGGAGFPNRNALTPPTPVLYTTYKHPAPLSQTHENPFTSSPPQITGSPPDESPFFGAKSETLNSKTTKESADIHFSNLHRPNLSLVYERTGEMATSNQKGGSAAARNVALFSPNNFQFPSTNSSAWLSTEPGPAISLEAAQGSPSESERAKARPRSNFLSSGIDPGLIHKLRKDDPRMASSPLSQSNSFAKLSRLGHKANITGTPEGTGMREVGSSLVGSSSPFAVPKSSPPKFQHRTPSTAESVLRQPHKSSPLIQGSISPLASHGDHFDGTEKRVTSWMHQRGPSFRDAPLFESRLDKQARRAVPGQKQLIEMTLSGNDQEGITLGPFVRPSQGTISSNGTHRPLLPLPRAMQSEPRLRRRYRSPSSHASGLRDRKQKISWIYFGACAVFPYLLILYGHSALDSVMVFTTNGDIQHFGHRQKRWARVVGWTMATITVLVVVIFFVVIRTVPNGFPR